MSKTVFTFYYYFIGGDFQWRSQGMAEGAASTRTTTRNVEKLY